MHSCLIRIGYFPPQDDNWRDVSEASALVFFRAVPRVFLEQRTKAF